MAQKMTMPAANQMKINSGATIGEEHGTHSKLEGRHKRSQYDFLNDYNKNTNKYNPNENDDEFEDAQAPIPTQSATDELDVESLPPFTYFLLLQKLRQLQSQEPIYRVRTPRLGRSIDLQLLDDIGSGSGLLGRGFDMGGSLTRQSKKSVPFKPRLGKRTKYCD